MQIRQVFYYDCRVCILMKHAEERNVYTGLFAYALFCILCIIAGIQTSQADLTHEQFNDQYDALYEVSDNLEEYVVYEDGSYIFGSDSGDIIIGGMDSDYDVRIHDEIVYHSYRFVDIISYLKDQQLISAQNLLELRGQLNQVELS